MSLFSNFKPCNFKGRKGYQAHIQGNQLIEKGEIAKAMEKHKQAKELYEAAYNEGCREPGIIMAYAVLLMRFNECEKARDLMLMCEKMKLDDKEKKQLRTNYAVCQWKLGNLDRAIELMESAGSNGMTALIYGTLGYYYIEKAIQTGDFEKAIEFNQQAYQYDEEDAGILDNLGQLNYAMGKNDEAYDFFSRAYRAKSTQVTTLYFIAKMNYERGNTEKARAFIQKALDGNFSALCSISRAQAQELADKIG